MGVQTISSGGRARIYSPACSGGGRLANVDIRVRPMWLPDGVIGPPRHIPMGAGHTGEVPGHVDPVESAE